MSTGEQFDANLNQVYLRARYYDPGVGRFAQQDTWMGNNSDPITLHKYLYANADPANNIDPSGNFSLGGLMSAINVQGVLTTVSVASSAFSLYGAATDEDGLTAKEAGFAILIAAAGPAAGKLMSLIGRSRAAQRLCDNVCGLLGRSRIIGSSIVFRNARSLSDFPFITR